jgi:molybdopterin-guanine dinucleotide biosynthesis protein B
MKAFSIAGWSGSGKTNLIKTLIETFRSKGLRVIAAKKVPHKYHLEPESKDSFKFLEAGSDEVLLIAKNQVMTIKKIQDEKEVFLLLEEKSRNCDILLLEGLTHKDIPKIEVYDSHTHSDLKFPLSELTAIVSDKELDVQIPCFKKSDIEKIIQFMENYDG